MSCLEPRDGVGAPCCLQMCSSRCRTSAWTRRAPWGASGGWGQEAPSGACGALLFVASELSAGRRSCREFPPSPHTAELHFLRQRIEARGPAPDLVAVTQAAVEVSSATTPLIQTQYSYCTLTHAVT